MGGLHPAGFSDGSGVGDCLGNTGVNEASVIAGCTVAVLVGAAVELGEITVLFGDEGEGCGVFSTSGS